MREAAGVDATVKQTRLDQFAGHLVSIDEAPLPARWVDRGRRKPEPEGWGEGLGITLRRLDRILADRRVVAIEVMGRRFDPRLARVVGTTRDARLSGGIVGEEVRAGFLWEEELLPAPEVIVNKADPDEEEHVR